MTEELREKIIHYYTVYYRDECSLPDWEKRAQARVYEADVEKKRMEALSENFNFDFRNKKHLLVGAGTGGLVGVLKETYGADVYGVEPSQEECEILALQCREHGIDPAQFHQAYGEALPFPDEMFDFIHCFTVLEHVTDVEKCIDEMLRVVSPRGRIIINTPNYVYPYEKHYKIFFPTFLPKLFGYLYLTLLGKNYNFYKTIQYITERSVNKILVRKKNIHWYRFYTSKNKDTGRMRWLVNYLFFKRFIYPRQDIIVFKAI